MTGNLNMYCFCFSALCCQGSVAIAGAVVRWLQDNLGIIGSSEELGRFCSWFGACGVSGLSVKGITKVDFVHA